MSIPIRRYYQESHDPRPCLEIGSLIVPHVTTVPEVRRSDSPTSSMSGFMISLETAAHRCQFPSLMAVFLTSREISYLP